MDLGLRTFPTGPNEGRIEIVQNLAIVIDIFRWTHSADWNLTSIFERTVEKLCPACTVEPELTLFYQKKIGRVAQWEEGQEVKGRSKIVGLRYVGDAIVQRDIGVQYKEKTLPDGFIPSPNTLITRYFTGSGQESGSLFVRIDNIDNVPAPVTILEVLPWYMRLYMHTLRVTLNGKPIDVGNQDIFKRVLYSPSVDRVKPTAIEYDLVIPAAAVLTFDLQFDMVLLRYTEYPLDPNRGVDVK